MKNFIYPVLIFLLPAVILFLPMGNGETFVKLAFGEEGAKKTETKTEGSLPVAGTKKILSDMPYTALAEKNIFNPERKEFPIFPTETIKKPLARPQVVLFGVTIAGDYQSASIVQIGRSLRKGEREMLTLKVGERIGEFKLVSIMPDRINLEAEGDTFEVLLYDTAKPKTRTAVKTESKPVSITSTLPGPTGPSPIEPPRPGAPGVPTSERPGIPRPSLPSPVPGQERVVTPPSVTPAIPPTMTPGTTPVPAPVTPTTPPAYFPRRGSSQVPFTPGTPAPPTAPQKPGGP
ncbi:MAG: hypothetical protein Q8P64_27235 [Deltaproteobacteria bacterium]|nr:hypothetical protein [Deltaproteobacteria bacterium]